MSTIDNVKSNGLYRQPLVEEAFDKFLSEKIRSSFPKVKCVENISIDVFKNDYVSKDMPVVIKGKQFSEQNINLQYFAEKAADLEVCINLYDTRKAVGSTIRELVSKIKSSAPDEPVYLQEWLFQKNFPEFLNDFLIPDYFDDDWGKKILGFQPMTLWIGSKGSITPIHEDTGHFNLFTAQLFGQKEWFLFHRDAHLNLNASGEMDFDEFLEDPNTQAQSVTLEEGDILFMPYKWWHRTITMEHSGSFNMPYVTEKTIKEYIQAILSMPVLLGLKSKELKTLNPMRYEVTKQRVELFADLMGFDPDYIINAIKNTKNQSGQEIEAKEAA